MSDIAIWRMTIQHSPDVAIPGYVIRLRGSEHFIDEPDWAILVQAITAIKAGATEFLGEEYLELQADYEAQAKNRQSGVSLAERLGLRAKPQPFTRRF